MTNREIAVKYINAFCTGNIETLKQLLADDLIFDGTLFKFGSAKEYLDSLQKDPPEQCGYQILSITEGENSVAAFYNYQKRAKTIKIAQLFKIENLKIKEILLIFDGRF